MKRQKQEKPISDELIDGLLKQGRTAEDINGLLKQLTKAVLERALQGELTEHLGYGKHDPAGVNSGNSRNGVTRKTLSGDFGELELETPRDRNGEFEPQIIRKNQTRWTGFDDKILSMYARGMTTREIQGHLQEMYQVEVSPSLISEVTDGVVEQVRAWQNRPLEPFYGVVFLDALYVKMRHEGRVENRAVYVAIGINLEGRKDVLGLWTSANEGAKFWLNVLTEMKNRGCTTGDTIAAARQTAPAGRLKWERDPVEMYAFHLTVPDGCPQLEIAVDFLATAAPTGFSASASTSANFAVLSWNTVVLSPAGISPANIRVTPSVTLPSAWQLGSALTRTDTPSAAAPTYTATFAPVPLDQLIDSPVLAGRYFRELPLAPEIAPRHVLDLVADGPEQLELSTTHIAQFTRLVREAGALFGSRHYSSYHFLVTLSDATAHFGLEHHQSSDDRVPAKTFIEDDRFTLAANLLPHEFTHSWNGKYRRPVGLATGNYESPMTGDLLWVYEGLTDYFGDVLAVRSGLWSEEDYFGRLARSAAMLDVEPGRTWRDLQDTARFAQVLYDAGGGWDNLRRGTDFYAEGELLWLDVDTTIRQLTAGRRSLNDFARSFYGPPGDSAPSVQPYTFDQLVVALNTIAPNDWATFLRTRLDSNAPHAPLGGIEHAGYTLTYTPSQTVWGTMQDAQEATVDLWFSLGLRLNPADTITDVLKGSPADQAGLGPGMHLVAVNGRAFTPWLLRTAVHDAAASPGAPASTIDLILNNGEYFRTLAIPYHGGERYPTLDRVPGTPDRLADILKPLAK